MKTLDELLREWVEAKRVESESREARQIIESEMIIRSKIDESQEGTKTIPSDDFDAKVTCKLTKKVDGERLIEMAHEAGLSDHLNTLFRWKPELNIKAWKDSTIEITGPLSAAITTKPARPSFKVTKK